MEGDLGPEEFSEPMPCYEANPQLRPAEDDGMCVHCRKFLTTECDYIDRFLETEEIE